MDYVEVVEKTSVLNSVLARPVLEWITIAYANAESLYKSLVDELLTRKKANSIEGKETTQIKKPNLGVNPVSQSPSIFECSSGKEDRSPGQEQDPGIGFHHSRQGHPKVRQM